MSNCRACQHSYMEPSGPARLICGEDGGFGKYVTTVRGPEQPVEGCGTKRPMFKQHPDRRADGSLKGGRGE